jgi:hypothetical protein
MRRRVFGKGKANIRFREILKKVAGLRRTPYGRNKLEDIFEKVYGDK